MIGKKNDEIRSLSEFIGESENPKIQINDIQDFLNICNFFENMKALQVQNDIEFIDELKTAFVTASSFINSFSNYFNNFKEIKSVYEEYLNQPEVLRNKIEQILKFSNIDIFFDKESRTIKVEGAYQDISKQNKKFNYDDLQELHDRALLFCNKTIDNIGRDVIENIEEKQKNFVMFIDIIENITQLINDLNSLYIKGYPFLLKILIQIKNKIAFSDGNGINLLLEDYQRLREDLENTQTKAYSKKYLIRLIYGHQFYDLFNYLFNKDGDIMPLLKRLSNCKIKKLGEIKSKKNFDYEDNEKNFGNMIEYINDFLYQCLKKNNLKEVDLYIENFIKNEFNKELRKGFYIWTSNIKIDIEIINIYKSITGNFPLAITTLLCTKETNEEEITSSMYRTILCEFRVLFIIIGSDNLELSKAQYLLWILDSLYDKYNEKINSTLLIAFSDNNSSLKKEMKKIKGHHFFIYKDFIKNKSYKSNDINSIVIWSSDATGVGKSTQIRLEADKNNQNYIYFPIGGVISRKDIISRIIKLEINTKNIYKNYLHIDIYDSNEETSFLIKEFLFSLLITRSYCYDERIFYLDYGVKIVIEIPVGFYDMKEKFVLLDYFPHKNINLDNLPDLIDLEAQNNTNNNLTDIQLITNILLMLENGTIEEKDIDLEKQ